MNLFLKEITTNKELKSFVNFAYKLYDNNKYWVPPLKKEEIFSLRKDKNPAFDFCETKYWLAYDDKKIVGRDCWHN